MNSCSVSSKNGFFTNPPPGLKIVAARGILGNFFAISSNAELTLLVSVTSVLMPIAWPPLELISCTTGLKLSGFRANSTTEYDLANRRAIDAPCHNALVKESYHWQLRNSL